MLLLIINVRPLSITAIKASQTTTNRLTTAQPQRPTEVRRITTNWLHRRTTVYLATIDVTGFPSESSIRERSTVPSSQLFSSNKPRTGTTPTGLSVNHVTSTGSPLSTSGECFLFFVIIFLLGSFTSIDKYKWSVFICMGFGTRAPQSPPKLAPKDAGLGAKVKTQANV